MVRKSAVDEAKEIFAGDIASIDGVSTDENGKADNLYVRIAKIIESLPDVKPEGTNTFFKYKFITDKQVQGLLRPRLSRNKIIIIPESVEERDPIELKTQKGGTSLMTRMLVTWRVVDGLNGESFTGQSLGYGDDGGDKGANKAFTAAFKNFLLKLFEIGGDTDIEDDESTDKRAAAREAGTKPVDAAVITEAKVSGVVKPGGRSESATTAQITRVGQFVREQSLTPEALVAVAEDAIGDALELSDKPWEDIKLYLEKLSGEDIGRLIARLGTTSG